MPEAKYGNPVLHWFDVLAKHNSKTHMEMVAVQKSEHAMGCGHANAIFAYFRAKQP